MKHETQEGAAAAHVAQPASLQPNTRLDWLQPTWTYPEVAERVSACMSTRQALTGRAASQGVYGSFNLGDHVGDDPVAVAYNRQRLAEHLQAQPVFLQQVHGTVTVQLQASDAAQTLTADACWTREPGLACVVMVADCLPLLVAHRSGAVAVGAAHAGWRGLAAGVIESLMQNLLALDPNPDQWQVWLGACIGPQAFEVGEEVRAAFVREHSKASTCFVPGETGRWHADLAALARLRLQRLGLAHITGNDSSMAWCTVSNPDRYYSHRLSSRQGQSTGRMAACIALKGEGRACSDLWDTRLYPALVR